MQESIYLDKLADPLQCMDYSLQSYTKSLKACASAGTRVDGMIQQRLGLTVWIQAQV